MNIKHKLNQFNVNNLDKIKIILLKLKKFMGEDNIISEVQEKLKSVNKSTN